MKELLPHGCNLLEQFDLKGVGLYTVTRPEPMKGVVVGDGDGEVAIDNHHHFLPHHLH